MALSTQLNEMEYQRSRKRKRPVDITTRAARAEQDPLAKLAVWSSCVRKRGVGRRIISKIAWSQSHVLFALVMFATALKAIPMAHALLREFPNINGLRSSRRAKPITFRRSLSTNEQSFRFSYPLFLHNGKEDVQSFSVDSISSPASSDSIPEHVAIICDGNSRWAQARGLPAAAGHAAGADRLVQVLQEFREKGVSYCTLYCFSTENWKRSNSEVAELWHVMEQTARRFRDQLLQQQTRILILGDLDDPRIPRGLCDVLRDIENETAAKPCRQTVCLAINYGGRRDILNAAKRIAKDAVTQALAEDSDSGAAIDSLKEDDLSACLCTSGIPDPDLVIRTSGEHRLSNFLLWNAAYAEIYFTDTLWPDFDATSVSEAMAWYAQRHRRFGARALC